MKFMISWRIPTANHRTAGNAFLKSGAPMPDGLRLIGRWHAPGSVKGWALVECDDPGALYEHSAYWADRLETEITPVLEDQDAAAALSKAFAR